MHEYLYFIIHTNVSDINKKQFITVLIGSTPYHLLMCSTPYHIGKGNKELISEQYILSMQQHPLIQPGQKMYLRWQSWWRNNNQKCITMGTMLLGMNSPSMKKSIKRRRILFWYPNGIVELVLHSSVFLIWRCGPTSIFLSFCVPMIV